MPGLVEASHLLFIIGFLITLVSDCGSEQEESAEPDLYCCHWSPGCHHQLWLWM